MRRRRGLATLVASLALHGAVLLALLPFVSRESGFRALFIDLTEWVAAETRGAGVAAAGPSPAPPLAGGASVTVSARAGPRTRPVSERPAPRRLASPAPPIEPAPAVAAPRPSADVAQHPAPQRVATNEAGRGEGVSAGVPAPSGAMGFSSGTPRDGDGSRGGVPGGPGGRGGGIGTAPDVSRGFALAVPGAGPGGPGTEYGPYLARLRQRVQESLTYPPAARRRGLAGTVSLEIVIRPDGAFGVVTVAGSSSHALLDEAAVATVKRLAPEPFPADVTPRILRVRLPVVFALE